MKVVIGGARDWPEDHRGLISARVAELPEGTEVITGGARDVDRWAHATAVAHGLPTTVIPAPWGRYGKRAGPIRNGWMLDLLVPGGLVIAFLTPASIGTRDLLLQANVRGLRREVHELP